MKTSIKKNSTQTFDVAIDILKNGGVVAIPTETFYGLGCSAFDQDAIKKIFCIKDRQKDKPLPIIASDQIMVREICHDISEIATELMKRFWPGPLTLVLKGKKDLPHGIVDGMGRVAVRVSSRPFCLALTKELSCPVTATSANKSNISSCITAAQVSTQLNGLIPLIIDGGETRGGLASTIIDCSGYELRFIRHGALYTRIKNEFHVC